jgi:hypothetical protein
MAVSESYDAVSDASAKTRLQLDPFPIPRHHMPMTASYVSEGAAPASPSTSSEGTCSVGAVCPRTIVGWQH